MKNVIPATMILGLLAGGVAHAQTGAAPANTAARPPTVTTTTTTPPTTTPPTTSMTAAPAARSDSTTPAAVSTTSAPSRTTQAPVTGANSFTEGQARARIEEKGFGNVTDLKKDDKGVWRGKAMKGGTAVAVALDYQGNIVGQ